MNFEMGAEMLNLEHQTIIVNDDVAVEDSTYTTGRRGVAGTMIVEKIVGSLAETGALLDECKKLGDHVNKMSASMGVAFTSCTVPAAGKPTFEINDDEIEIGMGIHGEPGIKREKIRKANPLVDDLCKRILDDFKLKSNDQISIMINSLGATPLEELYIISKRVNENLSKLNIEIIKSYIGRYATSMEMTGMSITLLKMDGDLKKYLFSKSECPFWIN